MQQLVEVGEVLVDQAGVQRPPKESLMESDLGTGDACGILPIMVWMGLPGMRRGKKKVTVIATHAVSA